MITSSAHAGGRAECNRRAGIGSLGAEQRSTYTVVRDAMQHAAQPRQQAAPGSSRSARLEALVYCQDHWNMICAEKDAQSAWLEEQRGFAEDSPAPAMRLYLVWLPQGKRKEARAYSHRSTIDVTEGLDTADLQEAKAL